MTDHPLLMGLRDALLRPANPSSDFDLNPGIVLPKGRKLRPAAVLVLIENRSEGPVVILTKRAPHLKHHPGQIAFPGGKQDDSDASLWDCAVREAWEEIGLHRDNVTALGALPSHETVTSFTVTPQVAVLNNPQPWSPEIGEVAEVFRVPLTHVLNPDNYVIEGRRWQGTMRRYYAVPYGPYYIWGATARMLRGLADRMQS